MKGLIYFHQVFTSWQLPDKIADEMEYGVGIVDPHVAALPRQFLPSLFPSCPRLSCTLSTPSHQQQNMINLREDPGNDDVFSNGILQCKFRIVVQPITS